MTMRQFIPSHPQFLCNYGVKAAEVRELGELFSSRGGQAALSVSRYEEGRLIAAAALKKGHDAIAGSGKLIEVRFEVLDQNADFQKVSLEELVLADEDRFIDWVVAKGRPQEVIDEVTVRTTPNPSNPETTISFSLPVASNVSLHIFDILGQRIRTLMPMVYIGAGTHSATWNGHDASGRKVASGVYFIQLTVGDAIYSQKITSLR